MNDIIVQIIEDDVDQIKSYMNRLSPEKRARIANSLSHVKTGLYSVAPISGGGPDSCPFIAHCPIPEVDDLGHRNYGPIEDYTVNRSCILEATFIKSKTLEYIRHLNVDGENPVEMGIVNELSLIDLYKNRAAMILSSGDKSGQGQDFLQVDHTEQDNGYGKESKMTLSSKTQLHPALTLIDQLEKRRDKLLQQLLQTRKTQTEIAIKMGKKREESQLIEELRRVRAMLDSNQQAQQLQLTEGRIAAKEELLPLKD